MRTGGSVIIICLFGRVSTELSFAVRAGRSLLARPLRRHTIFAPQAQAADQCVRDLVERGLRFEPDRFVAIECVQAPEAAVGLFIETSLLGRVATETTAAHRARPVRARGVVPAARAGENDCFRIGRRPDFLKVVRPDNPLAGLAPTRRAGRLRTLHTAIIPAVHVKGVSRRAISRR